MDPMSSTTNRYRFPSIFKKDCFCFNSFQMYPYWSEIIGYSCGAVFAIGWWLFIDAIMYSSTHSLPVSIQFDDWVPGILNTIALIMINSVDKSILNGNDTFYGHGITWRARLFAFIGVSLGVGSLGGSITILALKYINMGYFGEQAWSGYSIVIQNFLIFVSGMCLWLFRSLEHGEEYSIALP